MKGFLFLSKLAFILNLLFVLCVVLRLSNVEWSGVWVSVIVIGGWFLAFFVNILAAIWFGILLAGRKMELQLLSIQFVNAVVLIVQSFFFLI